MTDAQISVSGELLQDAQVRIKPLGEDRTPMPVLCLLLNSDGPSTVPVACEQVYPPAMRADADRAALSLRKGMRITVLAPIAHIRTTLTHCSQIQRQGKSTTTAKEAAHA